MKSYAGNGLVVSCLEVCSTSALPFLAQFLLLDIGVLPINADVIAYNAKSMEGPMLNNTENANLARKPV